MSDLLAAQQVWSFQRQVPACCVTICMLEGTFFYILENATSEEVQEMRPAQDETLRNMQK